MEPRKGCSSGGQEGFFRRQASSLASLPQRWGRDRCGREGRAGGRQGRARLVLEMYGTEG